MTREAVSRDSDPVFIVERRRGRREEGRVESDVSPLPGNEVHVSQLIRALSRAPSKRQNATGGGGRNSKLVPMPTPPNRGARGPIVGSPRPQGPGKRPGQAVRKQGHVRPGPM